MYFCVTGSVRGHVSMRVPWPARFPKSQWLLLVWGKPIVSVTRSPFSDNRRGRRTTHGSTTSTPTLCRWDTRRTESPLTRCLRTLHSCCRTTPTTPRAGSPWSRPFFTCSCRSSWKLIFMEHFNQRHIVQNPYDVLSYVEHKKRRLAECSRCSFSYIESEWWQKITIIMVHVFCAIF